MSIQNPPPTNPHQKTYLIINASHNNLGIAFVSSLLDLGHRVLATGTGPESLRDRGVYYGNGYGNSNSKEKNPKKPPQSKSRNTAKGMSQLWALTGSRNGRNLAILECEVGEQAGRERFVKGLRWGVGVGGVERLDFVVVNLDWEREGEGDGDEGGEGEEDEKGRVRGGGIMGITSPQFQTLLQTNTIGPLLLARSLLSLSLPIDTLAFITSDSGSAAKFHGFDDGSGAMAVSIAGLNMGLRHLAVESARLHPHAKILALYPGEVQTDRMTASIAGSGDVEGIISPEESVRGLLRVLDKKSFEGRWGWGDGKGEGNHEAEFWSWEGERFPW